MSCISVVRIGPANDNVSAAILRNALVDYFSKQNAPTAEAPTTEHRLDITNRYFSAQVLFKGIGEIQEDASSGPPRKEDGIILVFDAARSNPDLPMSTAASFDSLEPIHNRAEEDEAGDLLRLCVGVTMGQMDPPELRGKEYEKEYSRRILWCLDRSYEYVEADLSEEGLLKGHDDRDKEGFARIVEAISGTVWSSAKMGATKKKELKTSYAEVLAQTEVDHTPEENLYEPPDPSLLPPVNGESRKVREEKAREAILQQSQIDPNSGYLDDEDSIDSGKREQRRHEMEEERRIENLEGALRQAARIRELSISGSMTDDERRQRAGDAALLLMDLMGQVGFEESDEDGDVNSEEMSQEGRDDAQGQEVSATAST